MKSPFIIYKMDILDSIHKYIQEYIDKTGWYLTIIKLLIAYGITAGGVIGLRDIIKTSRFEISKFWSIILGISSFLFTLLFALWMASKYPW